MSEEAPQSGVGSSAPSASDSRLSKHDLPKMTIGTSEDYYEKMASIVSIAMLPNVLWGLLFNTSMDGTRVETSDESITQVYHSLIKGYLAPGAALGAFIAEAGDFSVCASWWPPGSHEPPKSSQDADEWGQKGMALMGAFNREIEKIRLELIWSKYGQEYWHLALISRDPQKPAIHGAVRAVLQPFMDEAASGGKPIWLTTTSEHARDIYLHYGWQLMRTVTLHGHSQWCMILYPPN